MSNCYETEVNSFTENWLYCIEIFYSAQVVLLYTSITFIPWLSQSEENKGFDYSHSYLRHIVLPCLFRKSYHRQ